MSAMRSIMKAVLFSIVFCSRLFVNVIMQCYFCGLRLYGNYD